MNGNWLICTHSPNGRPTKFSILNKFYSFDKFNSKSKRSFF